MEGFVANTETRDKSPALHNIGDQKSLFSQLHAIYILLSTLKYILYYNKDFKKYLNDKMFKSLIM